MLVMVIFYVQSYQCGGCGYLFGDVVVVVVFVGFVVQQGYFVIDEEGLVMGFVLDIYYFVVWQVVVM